MAVYSGGTDHGGSRCVECNYYHLLANTVDYGEFKNNRRDESVIFSMQTFVVKLASGIAGFISSMVLFVFHISSNKEAVVTEPIAASSRMGLRLSMTIIPIVVLVIGFIVFKKRYILTDRKLAEISKELEKNIRIKRGENHDSDS